MANVDYPLYKIVIDPESKKTNGFQVGDVVRREYYDHPNLIYSLMVVMETGVDIIGGKDSHYFIGALVEGDAPQNGQLLDFVRITSLLNSQRSGAMYLTASDDQAPYMDVIDGLGLEQSLACPEGLLETPDPRDGTKYGFQSVGKMELRYNKNYEGSERSLTVISREASNIYSKEKWGVRQGIGPCPAYPAKLLISFRSRSSGSTYKDIPLTFGYADDSVIEATKLITVGKDYSYHLFEVSIDYPEQYDRFFSIILTGKLPIGCTLYISELNIVALSDLAALTNGIKVRVGKVKGIVDPVFGTLDGYGAYFQNLYATKNVNIAGTLTAGDEKGFASTFYVGKIHKNAVRNSIDGEFINNLPIITSELSPTGIGTVWDLNFLPTMILQDKEWRQRHEGEWYCFSIWLKSPKLKYFQVNVDKTSFHFYLPANEWIRHSMPFRVTYAEFDLRASLLSQRNDGILASSPQLEAGQTPSQYQPTDGTLSYVEDYGAWFNKGGIGGTIQNPLLRLNEDGSICSRDGSFVINPDGTGHFASGRFRWSKDTITLQEVTIKWEDMDKEARDEMTPKSVSLAGISTFHYPDALDKAQCEPAQIHLFASDTNFQAEKRRWEYQSADLQWHEIANGTRDFILIDPEGHYWEGRDILSIKYTALYKEREYSDIFTLSKQYDGQDAYSLYIASSNGHTFRNGVISTTLTACVMKGGEDVSHLIPDENFRWTRTSSDTQADEVWNAVGHRGKRIEITGNDVLFKAVFDCEVSLSATASS